MSESNLANLRHRQIIFVSHFTLVLIFDCSLKILNCFVIDLFNLIDFLKFFGWFLGWDFTLLQFLVQLLDSGGWSADARVRIYLIIAVFILLQIWNRLFFLREWFLLHCCWLDDTKFFINFRLFLCLLLIRCRFRPLIDSLDIHFHQRNVETGGASLHTKLWHGSWTTQHHVLFGEFWTIGQSCCCHSSDAILHLGLHLDPLGWASDNFAWCDLIEGGLPDSVLLHQVSLLVLEELLIELHLYWSTYFLFNSCQILHWLCLFHL